MECCEIISSSNSVINCKTCNKPSLKVELFVLKHQLNPTKKLNLPDKEYFYCKTPKCPMVYFSKDGDSFTKEDVRIKIRIKEDNQDDLPVCYCFGFTERQIREDFLKNGTSKITEWIKQEVKAKHCACEYKNPSGHCCLGDIGEVIKRSKING